MRATMSSAALSLLVSEKGWFRKATATSGLVGVCHATCAYFGPVAGGSFGTVALKLPRFQAPQYFCTSGITSAGVTSPATTIVVYSGRYHRSKNTFEYANWLGMSSMSSMKPIVVCPYVCFVNAVLRSVSYSLNVGFATFLL